MRQGDSRTEKRHSAHDTRGRPNLHKPKTPPRYEPRTQIKEHVGLPNYHSLQRADRLPAIREILRATGALAVHLNAESRRRDRRIHSRVLGSTRSTLSLLEA